MILATKQGQKAMAQPDSKPYTNPTPTLHRARYKRVYKYIRCTYKPCFNDRQVQQVVLVAWLPRRHRSLQLVHGWKLRHVTQFR